MEQPTMKTSTKMDRRGQQANYIVAILLALALGAIAYFVTGFFLALGANLNTELGTGYEANSVPANITTAVNEGFQTFGDNMPLIAQVIIAVIVILLVMGLFFLFRGGKGGGM
jgi:ammonia channel protein AmtB